MFGFTTLASVSLLLFSVSAHRNLSLEVSLARPAELVPRVLAQAEILGDPLTKIAIPLRCSASCNLLSADLRTFTFISTLCSSVMLTQAKLCYDCLASSGSSVQALQKQADSFVSSCNAASRITSLPPAGVTIVATTTSPGGGSSGGTEDTTPSGGSGNTAPAGGDTGTSGGANNNTSPNNSDDDTDKKNGGERVVTNVKVAMVVLGAAALLMGI
ncbi:hypothetical protein B0H14DRAFT_2571539 [Mycena olivaceomarginata]|nr:hypothetical protein B0H14DRAFT_2571539 [Mycena olivaceomarginata]